jgi:hypothetical protein
MSEEPAHESYHSGHDLIERVCPRQTGPETEEREDRCTCNGTCHFDRTIPRTIPIGNRIPNATIIVHMCHHNMLSSGSGLTTAPSGMFSPWCSWAAARCAAAASSSTIRPDISDKVRSQKCYRYVFGFDRVDRASEMFLRTVLRDIDLDVLDWMISRHSSRRHAFPGPVSLMYDGCSCPQVI